jgi:DNA-binding NarL/FixJ family response regulator
MEPEITIVIADDHPIFRQGLRNVIEREKGLKVVGEAEDGEAALQLIEQNSPDVAVLDFDMPRINGLEVVRAMANNKVATVVVFLTMHKGEDLFNEAMNVGAQGYVLKDSAATDIVGAIKSVCSGQSFISPQLSSLLLKRSQRAESLKKEKVGLDQLSPTERRILQMIALNQTTREIAAKMFISPRTVENHRANICVKLDLHGAQALLRFALEHKSELL